MRQPTYRPDLAHIHDVGFGNFARAAAPGLLDTLRQHGLCGGLVIDLGCGSGIWAQKLATAGYEVLGIDLSPAMIALARRRVPHACLRAESCLTAELPPCVAVTAVGECFSYLSDDRNTPAGLTKLFRRTYQALCPGGLLIFDVVGPGRVRGPEPLRRFWEGDGWTVLVDAVEDRRRGVLTRQITSFRKVGNNYRRDHEVHRQRLFTPAPLAAQLRRIGFRVRVLRGYGPLRFRAGHFGLQARKPGRVFS
jgi:SAM-dependent methyltransferase